MRSWCLLVLTLVAAEAAETVGVHARDVRTALAGLEADDDAGRRTRSAAALGWLRAPLAATDLARRLADAVPAVRLQAAMALGWCGGRAQVPALLKVLDDAEWTVRQAAAIACANLTAGTLPFDALADVARRRQQADAWRAWWSAQPVDRLPDAVVAALAAAPGSDAVETRRLQALRAAGFLGGGDAATVVIAACTAIRPTTAMHREQLRSACRSLGRLATPAAVAALRAALADTWQARYAAYALGTAGDGAAVDDLLTQLPRFLPVMGQPARLPESPRTFGVDDRPRGRPAAAPADDLTGFDGSDRMYETPFAFASAIDRLPWTAAQRTRLVELLPGIINALPSHFDGGVFHEDEAPARVVASLLDRLGLRDEAATAVLRANGLERPGAVTPFQQTLAPVLARTYWDCPQRAVLIGCLCTRPADADGVLALLERSQEPWVRQCAARALAISRVPRMAAALHRILASSPTEASFGWAPLVVNKLPADEYQCPAPRWREGVARALGRCGGADDVPLLARICEDDANAPEVRNAAATALAELAATVPEALPVLDHIEVAHPLLTVRTIAREALWRAGRTLSPIPASVKSIPATGGNASTGLPPALVFIKGPLRMPDEQQGFQIDGYRQNFTATDSGPEYRLGRNLYVLSPVSLDGVVRPLTHFTDGWVASCEVSFDGTRILFSRRAEDEPWWHIWIVDADGGNLKQLTRGPYHHVAPDWLPDGRIVMGTSRLGTRDEYHGYLCTGLAVMNPDGSGIEVLGMNLGRDNEPTVLDDGRIGFGRLEVFYSRLKTEGVLQAVFPDGRRNESLYGPERRAFWHEANKRSRDGAAWMEGGPMHRRLRFTQIQPWSGGRFLTMSSLGPVITGPGRTAETLVPHDPQLAISSPYRLGGGAILCSVGPMPASGERFTDLDLAVLDSATGAITPIHRDPQHADFEARPLAPRPVPPVLATPPAVRSFTAVLNCGSAFITRERGVQERGRWLRVVEGIPHTNRVGSHVNSIPWKNHTGTLGRVLGTVPLPADGSFSIEVPADRLIHLQVLDADRQVVGNQLTWMDLRPGETRSCIGCHEDPAISPPSGIPRAQRQPPVRCLPGDDDFLYRAKVWYKAGLPEEEEERTRTVRAFNLAAEH